MTYHWYRTYQQTAGFYGATASWMCAIPSGSTYRRVRFSWGFSGYTASATDVAAVQNNILVAGLVTTVGNGTESAPNPITESGDAAPPTQRWIWWEARQPVATAIDEAAGLIFWRDSGPQEPVDAKAQVLATDIPEGDTLNLWFSMASTEGGWDPTGACDLFIATAVLYSTP